MKKILTLAVSGCALTVLLTACGEDKPSDELAAKTVLKFAERDTHPGLEVADFIRENGWVDDQSPNRYKVRFNYNLKLVKPYPEIVLDNAKKLIAEAEQRGKTKSTGLFDVNAMQNSVNSLQQTMAINQWIQNQGESFKPRYEKFISKCTPCIAYLRGEELSKDERTERFMAYSSSWGFFEDLGIKDEAAVGSGIPRQAWSAFMKTEKDWLPVE